MHNSIIDLSYVCCSATYLFSWNSRIGDQTHSLSSKLLLGCSGCLIVADWTLRRARAPTAVGRRKVRRHACWYVRRLRARGGLSECLQRQLFVLRWCCCSKWALAMNCTIEWRKLFPMCTDRFVFTMANVGSSGSSPVTSMAIRMSRKPEPPSAWLVSCSHSASFPNRSLPRRTSRSISST